jgi:hypothetical protein
MACSKGPLVWDKLKQDFVDPSTLPSRPEKFLKGPIPWPWLCAAAAEGGKCLQVGLCLWRLSGAKRSPTVRLSNLEVEALRVDRHAKSRALKKLEAVGLVSVKRRRGAYPVVTILAEGVRISTAAEAAANVYQ